MPTRARPPIAPGSMPDQRIRKGLVNFQAPAEPRGRTMARIPTQGRMVQNVEGKAVRRAPFRRQSA